LEKDHPELGKVQSQVLQNVCRRVELAYNSYFDRLADYQQRKALGLLKEEEKCPQPPRNKGKGVYDSITYPQAAAFVIGEDTIPFSKLGCVKAVVHRDVPGITKICTIRRQSGKWFACISCEVEAQPLPPSEEVIGIDVGLSHFAVTSDEEFIDNPRFFRKEEKALAKAQRKFDKVKNKHRTPERRKAKKVVARVHERVRNRRHNFLHQLTRRLVDRYDLIAFEALHVENMMASAKPRPDADNPGQYLPNGAAAKSGLNKSIADTAWSMFRYILSYKAESAGRRYFGVNPAYTSQDCSGCGTRVPKTLSERWHLCTNPECLLSVHRDINAAINILQIALELLKISVGRHRVTT